MFGIFLEHCWDMFGIPVFTSQTSLRMSSKLPKSPEQPPRYVLKCLPTNLLKMSQTLPQDMPKTSLKPLQNIQRQTN